VDDIGLKEDRMATLALPLSGNNQFSDLRRTAEESKKESNEVIRLVRMVSESWTSRRQGFKRIDEGMTSIEAWQEHLIEFLQRPDLHTFDATQMTALINIVDENVRGGSGLLSQIASGPWVVRFLLRKHSAVITDSVAHLDSYLESLRMASSPETNLLLSSALEEVLS
jgi:hypothetical protein